MTARQMHLTMWYAGHDPFKAMWAGWLRTGVVPEYMIRSMYAKHVTARTGVVTCGV